jgi:hypothetical protein
MGSIQPGDWLSLTQVVNGFPQHLSGLEGCLLKGVSNPEIFLYEAYLL